jgi:pyridoxamine 5'-phosphate oxidase
MPRTIDIAALRQEYSQKGFTRQDLKLDPIDQFRLWFDQAVQTEIREPNAMILSTADRQNRPDSRTVLLKAFDSQGFVFFTNYESKKATQLLSNPWVSLCFPWYELERQVVIQGKAEKVSTAQSLKYFLSRPFGSRLGAWVSQQSTVVSSRTILEAKLKEMERKFANGEVPLPSFWGGYCVRPTMVEFWQGGAKRLHDRFRYLRIEESEDRWQIDRLSP